MTDLTAEDTASETAAMWCIRLSEGDLSEAEWAEFDAWLAQPGHADLLQDAAGVWQATGALGDWPHVIALRTPALADYCDANRRRWLADTPGWLTGRIGIPPSRCAALTLGLAAPAMRPAAHVPHHCEPHIAAR